MGFIEDELDEVKKLCENVVEGCKLVSCVRTMVRAEIRRTKFKALVVCIQFPQDYPKTSLLIELKSKTLSETLLQKLTDVCEKELKKCINKAQVLYIIKFLRKFIDENPLSCCYDEITNLKNILNDGDWFVLKQKKSSILLKVVKNNYYFKCRVEVPDDYPLSAIRLLDDETNFSSALNRHFLGQAKEIARRCVEPPLRKKPNDPPFQPRPSLGETVEFLIKCVKNMPIQNCQYCEKPCFPEDPSLLEMDENAPKHIERIYCGHLFHQECFFTFMKLPPFGNKSCKICGHKVHHYKWSVSDRLAEERWAHQKARERELEEVTEFFK